MIKRIIFLLLISSLIVAVPLQAPVIGIYTQTDDSDEPRR